MAPPKATRTAQGVRIAAVASFVGALVVTLLSGVPHPLPAVALGSEPLLYIERGVVAFGALVIAIGLLGRNLLGELPSQVSTTGLTYSESLRQAVGSSDSAIADLNARIDRLDRDLDNRDELLMLLVKRMLDLSDTLEAGKGDAGQAGE
jgi:hypothetical protein